MHHMHLIADGGEVFIHESVTIVVDAVEPVLICPAIAVVVGATGKSSTAVLHAFVGEAQNRGAVTYRGPSTNGSPGR